MSIFSVHITAAIPPLFVPLTMHWKLQTEASTATTWRHLPNEWKKKTTHTETRDEIFSRPY